MRADLGQLKLDVKEIESTFKSGFGGIQNAARTAGIAIGSALGVGLGVSAITNFSKSIVDAAGHLQDLHDQTGVSAQLLSGMSSIFKESGTSAEAFAKGIFNAQRNIGQISKDSDPAAQAIRSLGLNLNELRNAKPDHFLELIADALGSIENPVKRAAVGSDLLGKSFRELAPVLSQVSGRFAELKAQGMNELDIKRLDDFGDSWTRLGNRLQVLASGPLASILEGFERIFNLTERATLTNALVSVGDEVERINKMLATRESLRGKGLGFLTSTDDAKQIEKQAELLMQQSALDARMSKLNAAGIKGPQSPFVPPADTESLNKIKSFLEGLSKQATTLQATNAELLHGKDLVSELNAQFELVGGNKNSAGFVKIRDKIVDLNAEMSKTKLLLEQVGAGIEQSDQDFGKANADQIKNDRETAIRLRKQTDDIIRSHVQGAPSSDEEITFGLTPDQRREVQDANNAITDAQIQPFKDLQEQMKQIAAQSQVFGSNFDALSPKIQATKDAIVELLRQGLEPLDPKIQGLQERLNGFIELDTLRTGVLSAFDGIATAVNSTLQGVFQGTQTWVEAMKNLLANMAASIANELQKAFILDPLRKGLSDLISNAGSGSVGGFN
ncbi:MAG: hypothetical protein ACREQO_26440, partial [Candidatus Binatia bacterium]